MDGKGGREKESELERKRERERQTERKEGRQEEEGKEEWKEGTRDLFLNEVSHPPHPPKKLKDKMKESKQTVEKRGDKIHKKMSNLRMHGGHILHFSRGVLELSGSIVYTMARSTF